MYAALTAEKVGPVDVSIIRFEGNHFNGDVAPALLQLQQDGTIRVIDLIFVSKAGDGSVAIVEATDSAIATSALARIVDNQFELLSEEDLEIVADELDPDSSAMVVVWENAWLSRLAAALRDSKAEVVALERIPRDVVVRAIAALNGEEMADA